MPQFDLSNFDRFILETEDDTNSPITEELMQQFRTNLVGLLILMLGTNISGTATGVAGAVLTDTGDCGSIVDGWTLLITSGDAKGNIYTIDAHDGDTITCTGDDLAADGVSIGDTWKAFYDCKVNLDGHDHDGINSKLGSGGLVTKTLTGTWNTDADHTKDIAHGLTLANIRSVSFMLLNDAGDLLYLFPHSEDADAIDGDFTVDATNVKGVVAGLGHFDAAGFQAATYNIVIWYVP